MTDIRFSRRTGVHLLALASLASLALAGCTSVASVPVPATASPTASASASSSSSTSSAPTCSDTEKQADPTRSYAPASNVAALVASEAGLQAIKQRGRLIVGVSADTRLLGARNPETNQIEGFDIEIAKAVATAIIGSPRIDPVVITAAQRIPYLQDGKVDLVARAMTITCDRWKQIAFSSVYFQAGQKLLVSTESDVNGIQALPAGSKVCAPRGSTSIARIRSDYPDLTPVEVAVHTECVVLFQEGKVDAITGDDAILAGFVSQDPYGKVVGAPFSKEPYGIGVKLTNKPLVQVVNKVLEDIRADGRWQQFYVSSGLQTALDVKATPPAPVYGR